MPLYEVQHDIALTPSQQDELAAAITEIHATKFRTPKLFVNVRYTDVSETRMYVGGKRRKGNRIVAHVRVGPSRTPADWNDLCAHVSQAWDAIVGIGLPKVRRADPDPDTSLRSIVLLGGLLGGLEAGFEIPPAGSDVEWIHRHWEAFNQRAEDGDEDFKDLVEEVRERGLLSDGGANAFDVRAAQQRLEEMLGWGDSA